MTIYEEVVVNEDSLKKAHPYRYFWLKIVYKIESLFFYNTPFSRKCKCSFTEIAHFDHNLEFDMEDFPCIEFKTEHHTCYIWIKEILKVGIPNWLWFVFVLDRDEFHKSLDLDIKNSREETLEHYTKIGKLRDLAHHIDLDIDEVRSNDLRLN